MPRIKLMSDPLRHLRPRQQTILEKKMEEKRKAPVGWHCWLCRDIKRNIHDEEE